MPAHLLRARILRTVLSADGGSDRGADAKANHRSAKRSPDRMPRQHPVGFRLRPVRERGVLLQRAAISHVRRDVLQPVQRGNDLFADLVSADLGAHLRPGHLDV